MFQFHKVQLTPNVIEAGDVVAKFQFHKVQLTHFEGIPKEES